MPHKPIQIKNLEVSFAYKVCFEGFTTQINDGSRIAIIGRNGSGKSSLLKILSANLEPTEGEIKIPGEPIIAYIPQIIEDLINSIKSFLNERGIR